MQQGFAATTDWRRLACDETRECGNQQPIHVIISSSLQAGGLGDRAPTPLLCGVEYQSEPAGP